MTCKDCIHCDVCEIKNYPMPPKAEECIDFQNKADWQEVKHGEWSNKGLYGWHTCSNCGTSTEDYIAGWDSLSILIMYNGFEYCPHCGTKMDGGNR